MKNNETRRPGLDVETARELYFSILDQMQASADEETECLTDRIANESGAEAILALQKDLKRARRRSDLLCRLQSGIRPVQLMDIVDGFAEPDVRREIRPIIDVITDIRNALDLRVTDGGAEKAVAE